MLSHRLLRLVALATLLLGLVAVSAEANNPVGTWLLTVALESDPENPFQELLVLHRGGTVSDTVPANHARPPYASDGYGVWERGPDGTVRVRFLKMSFGSGDHDGWIVLETTLLVTGDSISSLGARLSFRVGPDFDDPVTVLELGGAEATGRRITIDY